MEHITQYYISLDICQKTYKNFFEIIDYLQV